MASKEVEALIAKELEAMGPDVEQAAGLDNYLSNDRIRSILDEIKARGFTPAHKERQVGTVVQAIEKKKSAAKGVAIAQDMAKRSGDPAIIQRFDEASKAQLPEPKSAMQTVLGWADYPDSLSRELLSDIPRTDPQQREKFHKYVREKQPGAAKLADTVGAVIGLPGAALMVGIGAAGDIMSGRPVMDSLRTAKDVIVKDSPRIGGEAVIDFATSPLSYAGYGGGSTAKIVGKQLGRVLGSLGASADDIARLTKMAEQVAVKSAGTPRLKRDVLDIIGGFVDAKKIDHGKAEAAIAQVLGKSNELIGQRGLTIAGQDVGAMAGGVLPEQLARRAANKTVVPLLDKAKRAAGGVAPAGQDIHTKLGLEAATHRISKESLARTEEQLTGLMSSLSNVKKYIPKERQEELLKYTIDPEFRLVDLREARPTGEGAIRGISQKNGRLVSDDIAKDVLSGKLIDPDVVPYEVIPAGQWIQPNQLTDPHERQFVGIINDHLEKQAARLRDKDLLPAAGHMIDGKLTNSSVNWLSGKYFPRIFKGEDPWQTPLRYTGVGGRQGNVKKHRTKLGGVPLGAVDDSEHVPLIESMARYQPQVERAIAEKNFRAQIADWFGDAVKPDTPGVEFMTVKNSGGKAVHVPKQVMESVEAIRQSVGFSKYQKGTWDAITDMFKKNTLMGVPRYHLVNMVGDSMMLFMNGVRDPTWLAKTKRVWGKDTAGGLKDIYDNEYTYEQIRNFLKKNGIGMGHGAFDVNPGATSANQIDEAMRRAGGQSFAGFRADPKAAGKKTFGHVATLGMDIPGEWLAKTWDRNSKTAAFMHFLSRGEGMERALQRTFEALPDYTTQDNLLKLLRKFVPFATYQYKAAKMIPRSIARTPGAVSGAVNYAKAMSAPSDEARDRPPRFLTEGGITMEHGASGREGVARFAEGINSLKRTIITELGQRGIDVTPPEALDVDPAYGMHSKIREPVTETMAPYAEAIGEGNLDPLASMLHPALRAIVEAITERDLFTKADMRRPDMMRAFSPGDPFAKALEKRLGALGLPVQPGDLQASEVGNQMPWLQRNLPQFLVSPVATWIYNEVAKSMGAKGTVAGAYRNYSDDAELRSGLQALNLGFGWPTAVTDPTTEMRDVLSKTKREKISETQTVLRKKLTEAYKK